MDQGNSKGHGGEKAVLKLRESVSTMKVENRK
jgi:hypothetical protein